MSTYIEIAMWFIPTKRSCFHLTCLRTYFLLMCGVSWCESDKKLKRWWVSISITYNRDSIKSFPVLDSFPTRNRIWFSTSFHSYPKYLWSSIVRAIHVHISKKLVCLGIATLCECSVSLFTILKYTTSWTYFLYHILARYENDHWQRISL